MVIRERIGALRQKRDECESDSVEERTLSKQIDSLQLTALNYFEEAYRYLDEDNISEWGEDVHYYRTAQKWNSLSNHKFDKVRYAAVRYAIEALSFVKDPELRDALHSMINIRMQPADDTLFWEGGGYYLYPSEAVLNKTFQNEIASYIYDDDNELAKICEEERQDALENMLFHNRPYHDREFIFVVRDIEHIDGAFDPTGVVKYVFPLDQVPQDVKFPLGHPQANTMYYAHPLRNYYMPVETSEKDMFYERVHEMCRLFQCLGATEITTQVIKGQDLKGFEHKNVNVKGNANFNQFGVGGGGNMNSSSRTRITNNESLQLHQQFNPLERPYCPEDLVWCQNDPDLQTLIRQRLEGDMLYFSKRISSKEVSSLSSSKILQANASINAIFNNMTAEYDTKSFSNFEEMNETVWEITVKFKSIRNFDNTFNNSSNYFYSSQLLPKEASYLEEVTFILEDGPIGKPERRLLERKRIKLGLSESRAKEIEGMVAPNLSEEEKEYIELYNEFLNTGTITDRARKILDREAKSLGISQQRQMELEK